MKYQRCLIFFRPFLTIVTDPNFIHLATGLLVNLMACRLHLMKQACLYQVSGLSQIWTSRLYLKANRLCGRNNCTVGNFSRPVCKCSRQACNFSRPVRNFSRHFPRVRKFYNQQALKQKRQAINRYLQTCYSNRQALRYNDRPAIFFVLQPAFEF